LVGQAKLAALIAVINRFVYRYVNNVLRCANIDIFTGSALSTKHLTLSDGGVVEYRVV